MNRTLLCQSTENKTLKAQTTTTTNGLTCCWSLIIMYQSQIWINLKVLEKLRLPCYLLNVTFHFRNFPVCVGNLSVRLEVETLRHARLPEPSLDDFKSFARLLPRHSVFKSYRHLLNIYLSYIWPFKQKNSKIT